jgi:hypothetical protein
MSTSTIIAIALPILVLQIALQIYALYDLWKNRSAHQNAWVWVLVIVLLELLGPLVYFLFGRKDSEA